MTTSEVRVINRHPTLFINQQPVNPTTAYVGPRYVDTFLQAGIKLFTFYVPGSWWLGLNQYDFTILDDFIKDYVTRIPGAFFMPRIDLSQQGYPWWGKANPQEMNVLLDITTGKERDQLAPNPAAIPYLGHEVNLEGINLHSFHSQIWRQQAGQAVAALVSFIESNSYAEQIWGWHLCNGLFCEWFHWHEYSFGALSDYSPAAQADFRRWLRVTYQDDVEQISLAWGKKVEFSSISIPTPQERMRVSHGEFYDPIQDRAVIDYSRCFNQATADSLEAVCKAVKAVLPSPKVTCVFYGYQFSNMPRPQLNAHYAAERVLSSPYVDLIASPHAYSNRGDGGYHAPQALAESIYRAGKIHLDEIDCKTVWTPSSVTWKTHISQPKTVSATIEMMKKDAAYALSSGTAFWWMDLTDQGWFDAPEVVQPMSKISAIEERLTKLDRRSISEIAFVVSQRAMHFIAPREGLHNVTQKIFRNWHLSRMGAPFDTLLIDEIDQDELPNYKLYILANLFYLSAEQRQKIDQIIKQKNATALWIYAPGFLDDEQASLANMLELTGLQFGIDHQLAELDIHINRFDHPITHGLEAGFQYGTGIDREQYLKPPKIQYLPQTQITPTFFVDDPNVEVLGIVNHNEKPGLAVKEFPTWKSIYSLAPLLPWRLLQNVARYAGVHIYNHQGDMLWANRSFITLYSQAEGTRMLHLPSPAKVENAYTGEILGEAVSSLEMKMRQYETRLLLTSFPISNL
jgi:hypothetical protein